MSGDANVHTAEEQGNMTTEDTRLLHDRKTLTRTNTQYLCTLLYISFYGHVLGVEY